MALCAPDKMLRPMTSTSSCNDAFDDHFGSLAQAGVDDFHSGVAQCARDDLGAAIMAVEAGLGDEYANLAVCGHVGMLSAVSAAKGLNRE